MAKIMAVNAGSSSLKFQLLEMPSELVICSGIVERIGLEEGIFTIKHNGQKKTEKLPIPDHKVAVSLVLDALVKEKIVEKLEEIEGVGHRIVHGGEYFDSSAVVNEDVVSKVEELCELAPLHNPAHLVGYRAFKEALPGVGHVFVFDTAFHQTLDRERYLYPLPLEYYTDYKIRKYGAHGTSHKYVSEQVIKELGNPKHSRIIVCHLGNGASLSAVLDGKCIDTSMGFTPLAGVMMGSRCGTIDPSIMPYLCKKLNKTGYSAPASRLRWALPMARTPCQRAAAGRTLPPARRRILQPRKLFSRRRAPACGSRFPCARSRRCGWTAARRCIGSRAKQPAGWNSRSLPPISP